MTEWCEAIRLTKCQSDKEGTEPTLAQRRPNHHQKRQADNEGTEPPSAQRRLLSNWKPTQRMLFKSYNRSSTAPSSIFRAHDMR